MKVRLPMSCKCCPVVNPLTVLRCKVCANHTDVCCSGCRKPICRRHNAAPHTSFAYYCWDCRSALGAQQKTDPFSLQAHGSAERSSPN